ncbi:MAG TPA: M1 family aminopeptidase [Bryobacteraceae bacterium]|nr:M1 family aminopeptidase [Bryobacteraceae bacterium]
MRLLTAFLSLTYIVFAANTAKIAGIVTDPSGAAISGAKLTANGPAASETSSDDQGRFVLDHLGAGHWTVTVTRAGFSAAVEAVDLKDGDTRSLRVELKIAIQETTVEVTGKRSGVANADPNYRALRDNTALEFYHVENVELKRDVGVLTLREGQIGFLAPVLNRVTTAVFSGTGRFQMKPAVAMEQQYLNKMSGADAVDEEFSSAVLYFTDDTAAEIKKQAAKTTGVAGNPLNELRRRLRHRQDSPRTLLEALLSGEDILNIEAEMLAELYNPRQGGSFRAYLHGKHYGDLRFMVVPQGAMPMLPSPEEVALINVDPGGERDGIWYLTHTKGEWEKSAVNNLENKRSVVAQHYRIETAIARGGRLTAIADVRFAPLVDGVRVVHFGLLPALRVTKVTGEKGREVSFVQEDRKEDGSFYVILPDAPVAGKPYDLRIEYEGNKVLEDEGGGNFAVGARTSWYPSLNSFLDRATYDLTFKVPKQYTLVSVGRMVKEWKEGDSAASEWKSDVPLAVAGFNYGLFKEKHVTDQVTKYDVEAYTTLEVPSYLREAANTVSLTPSALANAALVDGQNSMRLFQKWFGPCPYGRIAITQQPQFNFGQSWPSLVYLPVSAFLDSTQRWMLLGKNSARFANFVLEVTPHEVAHQWWGHMVGWATYRDQWLSEGFAEFSAGVFLEATEKPDQVDKFWNRQHDRILDKNGFGNSANDAGPIWMGLRLNTFKTGNAYSSLVYPKGAFILHMLRMLMYDDKNGDQDFMEMMQDFVQSYMHKNASSESFRAIVEKHMKPALDLQGNHQFDWFYNDWVYGTDIPKYRLEYSLTPSSSGKISFTGKLTQSGVAPEFLMRVPIYFDFDGRIVRAGSLPIRGSMTSNEIKIELPKKPKRVLLNARHDVLAAEAIVKEIQ